jgi:hypothetical protein
VEGTVGSTQKATRQVLRLDIAGQARKPNVGGDTALTRPDFGHERAEIGSSEARSRLPGAHHVGALVVAGLIVAQRARQTVAVRQLGQPG